MNIMRLLRGVPSLIGETFVSLLRQNESTLAASGRRWLYGGSCHIDTQVVITNPRGFVAAPSTAIYHGCYVLNQHGYLRMGSNSHLGASCFVNVCYGNVTIGEGVAVGPGTKIFAYSNHYRHGCRVTDEKLTEDVVIGDNVFIGANCVVLPGTHIGDNVIIAAGSIAKGNLTPDCIYGGAPCKIIRRGWFTTCIPSIR